MSPPSSQAQGSATQGVRLSMATENYLLTIFRLEERDFRVTPSQLAEHLKMLPENEGVGTSLPSVGGMIRRMAREGLAESGPNKNVVLTKKGRQSAEMIVRRHRLAERLVVDLLGIDLHRAHIEAHLLEHAISAELEKKIEQRLGGPTTYGRYAGIRRDLAGRGSHGGPAHARDPVAPGCCSVRARPP